MVKGGTKEQNYVWEGAIPLLIHLHDSEVTSLPPPPPISVLAPRLGYLPLLAPVIKPHFSSTLPPGDDTVWFEYNGLPLKWYIPTGVLFDFLCAEPVLPWNLTVHFRGYPINILTPCEGEDALKWNFINTLKEAAYIINGNCKNIMNMSQSDQTELWHAVVNVNLESFLKVSSKLKLEVVEDEYTGKLYPSFKPHAAAGKTDNPGLVKTGRIPVRLYVRIFTEEFGDLEDVPVMDGWENLSYINRPVDFGKDEGEGITLDDALKVLLPEYYEDGLQHNEKTSGKEELKEEASEHPNDTKALEEATGPRKNVIIKLVRIQGIELNLDIPFSWVVYNLMNPDYYLHICVYVILEQPAL